MVEQFEDWLPLYRFRSLNSLRANLGRRHMHKFKQGTRTEISLINFNGYLGSPVKSAATEYCAGRSRNGGLPDLK